MAVGILQLWPFYERVYKLDRKDPVRSARAWMSHIVKQLPKVKSWHRNIKIKRKNGC